MDKPWSSQLKKGCTELAALAALRGGESYGYQLLQSLEATGPLATTESTLYPLLARLADEGLIAVRVAASTAGPPRRYYRLTRRGETHLNALSEYWHELSGAMERLLSPPAAKLRA